MELSQLLRVNSSTEKEDEPHCLCEEGWGGLDVMFSPKLCTTLSCIKRQPIRMGDDEFR